MSDFPLHFTQLIDGTVVYTADQMQAYARAAVAAERERCAKLCEAEADLWKGEQDIIDFRLCAAAIRREPT